MRSLWASGALQQKVRTMAEQRVAIGAIFTECNQFGGETIEMDWFARYELRRGDEVLAAEDGVLGGMLSVLAERNMQPLPLLYASTCPGGPLSIACYSQLKDELLVRLEQAQPVDAVLLPLHGAAAVEGGIDLEGDLITAVRAIVGEGVLIVATLDLHAHISEAMVRGADGLVAWETYPHRDAFSTGERGARLLCDALEGRCKPAMVVAKVPVLTGAIHGSTEDDDPFAEVMRLAKAEEGRDGILSTSAILVHPYLDFAGMGSGAVVISDGDYDKAEALARELAGEYWRRRCELEPTMYRPDEAVAAALAVDGGPVVIVEAADCCGGGAVGDSVAALKALLAADLDGVALVPLVDAEAAAVCHQAGIGAEVELPLGHRHDPRWGEPIEVNGKVVNLSDGRFTYRGGIWEGLEGEMGPTAVLALGNVQVLVASHPTYEWDDEQFAALGMNSAEARIIVAKNPMNYRMAYGAVSKAVYVLDTPGPTPATVRNFNFVNRARPFFPLDFDMELDHIEILRAIAR